MLRRVFVIATLAACHPAPAPTVVRATPPAATVPAPATTPVRQDYDVAEGVTPGPLHEVLATGHECRQEPPAPIDGDSLPPPRRLVITATPIACERHRDGQPILH